MKSVPRKKLTPLPSSLFRAGLSQLAALFSRCIAKNIGGYTLETRRRRHRAASAEGERIDAPKTPGVGFFKFLGGVSPPQPTRESGGAS